MKIVRSLLAGIAILATCSFAHAAAPSGGFWESDTSTTAYAPLSASQISSFLPSTRSAFTFPAPYNTQGVRVTLPSDCPNSSNCVQYIGYDYWARMNNSAGSPFMYILVGLGKGPGALGPTIYKYDKDKDKMTLFEHLFTNFPQVVVNSAQTMYFSHDHQYGLYYYTSTSLNRINILTQKATTIFNLGSYGGYQSGDSLYMCSSSYDDNTHSCIIENSGNTPLGCLIYHSDSGQFHLVPNSVLQSGTTVHQCHMGADGQYMIMTGSTTPYNNTVVWNIASNSSTYIPWSSGGGGHFVPGYGYYLQLDGQSSAGGKVERLWDVSNLSSGGAIIWEQPWSSTCPSGSCSTVPQHPSWLNALPASQVPIAQQYACDSTSNYQSPEAAFGNQIYCFYLDKSVAPANMQSLVVAPTMINQTKTGCPGGSYGQYPKGNIDFTGHYFIWSANLDSNSNCQVFITAIPTANLPYPPADLTPPEDSIRAPTNGASVSGTVTLKANATDNIGVKTVTWKVDGTTIGTSNTAPYSVALDTGTLALGTHTVSAVAADASGNKFATASGGDVEGRRHLRKRWRLHASDGEPHTACERCHRERPGQCNCRCLRQRSRGKRAVSTRWLESREGGYAVAVHHDVGHLEGNSWKTHAERSGYRYLRKHSHLDRGHRDGPVRWRHDATNDINHSAG